MVRQRVMKELLDTEKNYVKNLGTLEELLVDPVRSSAKRGLRILKDSEFTSVFSNLSVIYQNHLQFLQLLTQRVESQADDTTTATVGDLFLNHVCIDR